MESKPFLKTLSPRQIIRLPLYLITKLGTIWVVCKKCGDAIPIWQAADEGAETTGLKFTCPKCRGGQLSCESRLDVPEFVNLPKH